MEIKQNQALTPEKKDILIEQIQQEISLLNQSIKDKNYTDAAYLVLQKTKDALQSTLNKLFEKKGVITPAETNTALDQISAAKKARLEEEYLFGIRKITFYGISVVVLAIGAYIYFKRKKS